MGFKLVYNHGSPSKSPYKGGELTLITMVNGTSHLRTAAAHPSLPGGSAGLQRFAAHELRKVRRGELPATAAAQGPHDAVQEEHVLPRWVQGVGSTRSSLVVAKLISV